MCMGRNDSVADGVLNPTLSLTPCAAPAFLLVRFFLSQRAPVLSPGRSFFYVRSPILLTLPLPFSRRDSVTLSL